MAAAIAAAKSGYESSSGAKTLKEPGGQGLSSNGSAEDGRNNYAKGRATAIAVDAGGHGPAGPTIPSNISTSNGSSEVSSAVLSSLASGSATKPFTL
ncbi:hypothetical protein AVEN_235136-1 [Araneus ventricosus]|uniref:Uncharacterized protein n=1 Tax=Araneus ventricosus TaxID=182803 RepID=A0A4Y2UAB5_ARAVE|nr:hypothetical protein AVEN_235136-1 [Araneus ventricosus]